MSEGTQSTEEAPKRGHLLTIARSDDWTEGEPYFKSTVTCLAPGLCGGWQECRKPHEVDGTSADDGPWDAPLEAAWCEEDCFTFHGVEHEWRSGWGWTVPFEGCVVAGNDHVSDFAHDLALEHGIGAHEVEDDWDDDSLCALDHLRTRPGEPA